LQEELKLGGGQHRSVLPGDVAWLPIGCVRSDKRVLTTNIPSTKNMAGVLRPATYRKLRHPASDRWPAIATERFTTVLEILCRPL
jgi:hypothetical protein